MMVSSRSRLLALGIMISASLVSFNTYAQAPSQNLCREDTQADSSESPIRWLERSLQASHCYTFQARAVAINSIDVRTLALSHRIQDGVRQQVVQQLDGPSVSVERRSRVGQLAWVTPNAQGEAFPSLQSWVEHTTQYYDVGLENGARVAGRDAVKLRFEPKDHERYTHEWWLDDATGLLLKHVLSDPTGRILETFQVTQLHEPERYTGDITVTSVQEAPEPAWHPAWLPKGFVAQPVAFADGEPHQRLYSDGLATISLFAEPQDEAQQPRQGLNSGVHQIGVSSVVIEEHAQGDQRWQLVGVGELPPSLLQRVVHSVEFD
ncbi:MucB/RseB C-terminal domain-containing protein [Halomonas aquamarina]|uniref:MucB/RseB C-terminal domain-containing protein n=1 Tax=Vreelandella aquamarina TaxID=77097 RepID=A0ACC5VS72_9GAMM|nr:MucB/RseB C-terminal domain-containing protein [Halomonas aquamarina]MBZ5486749.1 MucB/RseB C-terminal domain-containing protein [Halomonas aquamarina]